MLVIPLFSMTLLLMPLLLWLMLLAQAQPQTTQAAPLLPLFSSASVLHLPAGAAVGDAKKPAMLCAPEPDWVLL